MRPRRNLKVVWQRKEKNRLSPSPILPFQTGTPFLLLPLSATPHKLEREPVSRLDEKLVEVRSTRCGPVADGHPITPDTKESVRGPHLPSPHTPSDAWGGEEKEKKKEGVGRETEVARKECPASQKLIPLPRSGTEVVVVAPAPPSPVPGAR